MVDPLEGQVFNDDITVNDYNKDENNINILTNASSNVNVIMNDIINNDMQAVNDNTINIEEPKTESVKVEVGEALITLTEILTGHNEPEDMYIDVYMYICI